VVVEGAEDDELKRHQVETAAFLEEQRDGDLLATPQQMSGHRRGGGEIPPAHVRFPTIA